MSLCLFRLSLISVHQHLLVLHSRPLYILLGLPNYFTLFEQLKMVLYFYFGFHMYIAYIEK